MVTIALDADSLNSSYLDTKGWIYYQLEEYDKAQEYDNELLAGYHIEN